MAVVEDNLQGVSNRLTAIETIILHLATKADIERMQNSLIKWFIGTWLATVTILVAILGPLLIYMPSRLS